ncbi:hypothetical protein E1162_05795 [Rhodobacteraceae bacterium RKSG542]|uniref:hypothetical protein n=1 Tax=Pseudovibrio flavus TaxID=2529854 RepID=UPI0012BCE853|nr:hypothetical protein [Pseudovibrio flavus]MTI16745.1 hypothetical protein [Pseudovibrio flavus]
MFEKLFLFIGKTFALFVPIFFVIVLSQFIVLGFAAKGVAAGIAGTSSVAITTGAYIASKRKG